MDSKKKCHPNNETTKKFWSDIELEASSLQLDIINRPSDEQVIIFEMTTEDMNLAKVELHRLECSTPDEIGFKRDSQYVIGDINLIINRMRGNNRIFHGVPMVCQANPLSSSDFIDIMNPYTFNNLIKMSLQQPTASFDCLMSQAKEQFSKELPFEKSEK